jgi:hypothetical protein
VKATRARRSDPAPRAGPLAAGDVCIAAPREGAVRASSHVLACSALACSAALRGAGRPGRRQRCRPSVPHPLLLPRKAAVAVGVYWGADCPRQAEARNALLQSRAKAQAG